MASQPARLATCFDDSFWHRHNAHLSVVYRLVQATES
jgi:hypothetical protein